LSCGLPIRGSFVRGGGCQLHLHPVTNRWWTRRSSSVPAERALWAGRLLQT